MLVYIRVIYSFVFHSSKIILVVRLYYNTLKFITQMFNFIDLSLVYLKIVLKERSYSKYFKTSFLFILRLLVTKKFKSKALLKIT